MRDWFLFHSESEEEIPEENFQTVLFSPLFTENILDWFFESYGLYLFQDGVYIDLAAELMGFNTKGNSTADKVSTAAAFANAELIAIADAADAVTETDGKLRLDINKMLYTLMTDAKKLLSSMDRTTTISDFLKNETVAKYMESIFRTTTAEKIQNALPRILRKIGNDMAGTLSVFDLPYITNVLTITPNINSTAYEYFVKLITSLEFRAFVNRFLGDYFFPSFNLDVSPEEFFDFDPQEILNAYFQNFRLTENEFIISYNGYEDETYELSVTSPEWTYTLNNDGSLAALSVGGTVKCPEEFFYGGETVTRTIDGTLTFSEGKAGLTDADHFSAVYGYTYHYADGVSEESVQIFNGGHTFQIRPIIQDDNIERFQVFSDGTECSSSYNAGTGSLTLLIGTEIISFNVEIVFGSENNAISLYVRDMDGYYLGATTIDADPANREALICTISEYGAYAQEIR